MDQRTLFKTLNGLANDGQNDEALRQLRDALARGTLDAAGVDKAGRMCAALFAKSGQKTVASVLILGQCTTTWLVPALTAAAWADGIALHVTDGAYDNVLQELVAPSTTGSPDVVVLLPWSTRLLSRAETRSIEEHVADECGFWRQASALAREKHGARVVQVGYDVMTPGSLGYLLAGQPSADLGTVRSANDVLRRSLPPGDVFVDLEQIAAEIGKRAFYDPRRYHWTKQPFSEDGTVRLAQHLAAATRALVTGPKKVLVLDLDNTLWGGVVGETGPHGIAVGDGPDGEAFTAFQKHVKALTQRGIVLAVSSKNNDADAREPFEKNANMALSLDDFAQFEASWDPKAVALRRIASTLQLGLDSVVFFDDNPAEREHIRQAIPEVTVVEVPEDPAEYVRALDAALCFEAADITTADRERVAQYRSERQRRDAEVAFDSLDSYLTSLDMVGDVRAIDSADLDRVVQLIGKTNQFNLTTRRHSSARVQQMLLEPGTIGLTLRVADRFGDHGLVAVLLAVSDSSSGEPTLHVDTWLMSCRVINRTVEEFMFNVLLDEAERRGVTTIKAVYIPTAKNALVKNLCDRLGFERCNESADRVDYRLVMERAVRAKTFVQGNALAVEA